MSARAIAAILVACVVTSAGAEVGPAPESPPAASEHAPLAAGIEAANGDSASSALASRSLGGADPAPQARERGIDAVAQRGTPKPIPQPRDPEDPAVRARAQNLQIAIAATVVLVALVVLLVKGIH